MTLLATLRERRTTAELAGELEGTRGRVVALEFATEAFITCIKALALDIDEIGAAQLKQALDETLSRVNAGASPAELTEHLIERKRETLTFADAERRYLSDRESEMRNMINVLREGLSALVTNNTDHSTTLLARGQRIEAASQLGDIVKIRQAIGHEVGELRRVVVAKQAEDIARNEALTKEVNSLREGIETARTAAATDPLTGAANRGAFDAEIARLIELAAAGGDGFSLLLIDIDHFKAINDTRGHQVGDRVLTGLVAFCREHLRRSDFVARWGGEEFALLLPSTTARVAMRKAQAMVKTLSKRKWIVDETDRLMFTMSVGVVAWKAGDDAKSIVDRADRALYQAKRAGRNRAVKD